jgi:hypothetical protein
MLFITSFTHGYLHYLKDISNCGPISDHYHSMETFRSLGLHCYDDICHCDWRITLYGCIESDATRIVNIINISISGLVSIIGIDRKNQTGAVKQKQRIIVEISSIGLGLLYQRIILNGHTIMDHSPKKGLLRPKPIDSMIFILTIFNISEYSVNWPTFIMFNLFLIVRLISSAILVTDVVPDNMIFRSCKLKSARTI